MLPGHQISTSLLRTANQLSRRGREKYSLPKELDARIGKRWMIRTNRRKPTRSGTPPHFRGPGTTMLRMSPRQCTDCRRHSDGWDGRQLSSRSSSHSQDRTWAASISRSALCPDFRNSGEGSALSSSAKFRRHWSQKLFASFPRIDARPVRTIAGFPNSCAAWEDVISAGSVSQFGVLFRGRLGNQRPPQIAMVVRILKFV